MCCCVLRWGRKRVVLPVASSSSSDACPAPVPLLQEAAEMVLVEEHMEGGDLSQMLVRMVNLRICSRRI